MLPRPYTLAAVCGLLWTSLPVAAAAIPGWDPQDRDAAGDQFHPRHGSRETQWDQPPLSTGDSHIVLSIPRRITLADVHAWSDALSLSDAQRAYFESVFFAFQERQESARADLLPLWEWSASLVDDLADAYRNPELAADLIAMHDAEEAAIPTILEMERTELFDPLTPILTEEQLLRLPIVRNRRLRDTYRCGYAYLPLVGVDLSKLTHAIIASGVTPLDQTVLQEILDEYERTLTRLLGNLARANHAAQRGVPQVTALAVTRQIAPATAVSRKDRLRKRVARAEDAIGDLNEMYMPVIGQQVEPALRRYFVDVYRIRAHPHVYPNPFDLRDLFHTAIALDRLSSDKQASLRELLEVADYQDQVIAERMIRAVRTEFTRMTSTMNGGRPDLYREQLDAITRERRTVAEQTIELMRDALSEDNRQAMTEPIASFWEHAESFKPADPLILYYPAYPPKTPDMTLTDTLRQWYIDMYEIMQGEGDAPTDED